MASVDLKIYGRVQGVFFRQSAKVEADKLDLAGWIRNDPDGTVEALAVGPKDKLDQFIKWCKGGPEAAKVERVESDWNGACGRFSSFDIL